MKNAFIRGKINQLLLIYLLIIRKVNFIYTKSQMKRLILNKMILIKFKDQE